MLKYFGALRYVVSWIFIDIYKQNIAFVISAKQFYGTLKKT
jgi:hypothetical protein